MIRENVLLPIYQARSTLILVAEKPCEFVAQTCENKAIYMIGVTLFGLISCMIFTKIQG
jgi:hypothetical protein